MSDPFQQTRSESLHKQMCELNLKIEQLDDHFDTILNELDVTAEQLHTFTTNSNHFTSTSWEKIEADRKHLDEKLCLDLENIKDPLHVKKTFAKQGTVQPHWLFVR
jgi:uncharacterized protein with NRDE domain